MQLDARGHPLHTRALSVTLLQRADGKLDMRATVLDLRKRGLVPVAGDLHGAGIMRQMRLDGIVNPATAILEAIAAEQSDVAFEPAATTRGESCRDPIAAVQALAGASLDGGFARRVSAAIGGPRGCSHIVMLAHFAASTATWALARDREAHGPAPARPPGQRVFCRDLIIDTFELPDGDAPIGLVLQLTDRLCAPTPEVARPMDRLASHFEACGSLAVEFPSFALRRIALAERHRDGVDFDRAAWVDRHDLVAELAGQRFGFGVARELLQRFGGAAADRPLLDVLLMVGPALIQCAALLSHAAPLLAEARASVIGMSGLEDSCYMWRRDGALARAREAEGGQPPRRP